MEQATTLNSTESEPTLPIEKFREWIEGASDEYVHVVDADSDIDLMEIRKEKELLKSLYVSYVGQFDKAVFLVNNEEGESMVRVVVFFQPDHNGCISMDIYRKKDGQWSRRPGNHDFVFSEARGTIENALRID